MYTATAAGARRDARRPDVVAAVRFGPIDIRRRRKKNIENTIFRRRRRRTPAQWLR